MAKSTEKSTGKKPVKKASEKPAAKTVKQQTGTGTGKAAASEKKAAATEKKPAANGKQAAAGGKKPAGNGKKPAAKTDQSLAKKKTSAQKMTDSAGFVPAEPLEEARPKKRLRDRTGFWVAMAVILDILLLVFFILMASVSRDNARYEYWYQNAVQETETEEDIE
ncbi:MAG: hypothetical protein K6G83_16655 [Lachnospiraceae bacterium]|nr:hypothetical protein [Lachnospiraceae bacterium]